MYHFNSQPGGNYQHPHYPAPGGYNIAAGSPTQQHQAYPPQQNPPVQHQHYEVPPQIARSPMPPYSGYTPTYATQAPVFHGRGSDQQQVTAQHVSHTSNVPFAGQQAHMYAPFPRATMPPQAGQRGPQSVMPNNAFPSVPQRQPSQCHAKSFQNKSSESCYNCGAPDHWAQDCPEPRRAVPAGQMNRPSKRQKTHGSTATGNHQVQQQSPPHPQGVWTNPATTQNSFMNSGNRTGVRAIQGSEQRPWAHSQGQQRGMSSVSSDGALPKPWTPHPHQSHVPPISTGPNGQNSWTQQTLHQSGKQNVTGTKPLPWSAQAPGQPYASLTLASASDSQSWSSQQPRANSEQSTAIPHNVRSEGEMTSQVPPWAAHNLPTPAPSSIGSQIPSPATSNPNLIDQNPQSTPRTTESPRNRHDSVSSTHRKKQDPRTQQAEMVASLFSGTALTPASKPSSPESAMLVEDTVDDLPDDLDQFYGLDFPDVNFEQNLTVSNPALLVTEPLPSRNESTENEQPRMTNTSSTMGSQSKYVQDVQGDDFLISVQESSKWGLLKDDPVFAKIKANTPTITFNELIQRRCHLVEALAEEEENDEGDHENETQEVDQRYQETEEERFTREQEERLAALGVTGAAKPVKASPRGTPLGTPSPAEILVATRVSGDPGWKRYENGRAVEHRSGSVESPSSTTKDGRYVGSARHRSPSVKPEKFRHESPRTDRVEQQPYRKRTYSDTSEEIEIIPKRQATEAKQRKPKFKQPVVAAAYGRRW